MTQFLHLQCSAHSLKWMEIDTSTVFNKWRDEDCIHFVKWFSIHFSHMLAARSVYRSQMCTYKQHQTKINQMSLRSANSYCTCAYSHSLIPSSSISAVRRHSERARTRHSTKWQSQFALHPHSSHVHRAPEHVWLIFENPLVWMLYSWHSSNDICTSKQLQISQLMSYLLNKFRIVILYIFSFHFNFLHLTESKWKGIALVRVNFE